MPSPAAANRPPWAWKLMLVGASGMALAVSSLAYLDDEPLTLLPIRLVLVLLGSTGMVSAAFAAGHLRQQELSKK